MIEYLVAGVDPVSLSLSLALSYAASLLLAKKDKSVVKDDKPTSTATRGAYLPLLVGRRRLGPVIGWAGDRITKKEHVPGGGSKGGPSSPEQTIFYEAGWHQLAVGPCFRLHDIRESGKVIWTGPIDRFTHPSGSTVSAGKYGTFQIYWGERDQPVCTFLGQPQAAGSARAGQPRVGVTSRWPNACFVLWTQKRLDTSPIWPFLDYDLEAQVQQSALGLSKPAVEPSRTLTGASYLVLAVTNGPSGVASITIEGDHASEFQNGGWLLLTGNSAQAGDYRVRSSLYVHDDGAPPPFTVLIDQTTILLETPLVDANVAGNVQPYALGQDDGVNSAHGLYQLLFRPRPHGIGLDPAHWNLEALEEVGQLIESERLPASLLAADGESAAGVVASIMQDVGLMLGLEEGVLRFKPIRAVDPETIPVLTEDVLVPPLPQIESIHGPKKTDRLHYTFQDRRRFFRVSSVAIGDDGHASYSRSQRGSKVDLPTVIDYETARKVSERRSQEDLAGAVAAPLAANREARALIPGQAILVAGMKGVQRVAKTTIDPSSGVAKLSVLPNFYGVTASGFLGTDAGGQPGVVADVAKDLAFAIVEVPAYISPGVQTLLVPRIRANASILGADLFLSRDDVTYQHEAREFDPQTGGVLTTAIAAIAKVLIEEGPTFTALGPDIATVLDLSMDPLNWRAGRQICVIDGEIFFLRNVTALGGGVWRLDGLLRARFDTDREAHPVGSRLFIFQATSITWIQDPILLAHAVPIWAKTQPFTTESVDLATVPARQLDLVGKGLVPMRPENLRTANLANAYKTGQNISLKWTYRSSANPRTGAGMQGAGEPVGASPVQGEFLLRFKTTAGTVKREVGAIAGTSFVYANAQLQDDFGSQPTSIKVELFNVNGGLRSPSREILVTKVA